MQLRKTKLAYANEGAEKAKQEEEVVNRKRKVEAQAKWEGESCDLLVIIFRCVGGRVASLTDIPRRFSIRRQTFL